MKLTPNRIKYYDAIKAELEDIGRGIAKGLATWLYCESFEVENEGINFSLWQYGCRGGANEGWESIVVTFDELSRDNVISVVVDRFKQQQEAKRQQQEAHKLAEQERTERATLERLQQKYNK